MNIFDTAVLAGVVAELPAPAPFLLNSFFPTVQTEDSEEIHFDVDSGRRRLAPFVSPVVAGQVVQSQGYTTKSFKPAYIKDKRVFDANRPFKRAIGERMGGAISPAQRLQLALARDLADQIGMLTRRQEVMAAEVLRTGKITVEGDLYPKVVMDFGRHADLTPAALTSTAKWGESAAKPLANLQEWSLKVTQHSGAAATTVIMDVASYAAFSAATDVQKLLDRFRGQDALNPTVVGEGGRYMGSTGDFDIWVYTGWYEHPTTGVVTPYLPAGTVIITSPDLEGVRAYGAIKDEKAGFQAVPYFSKSWVEEDPAVRYLMLQSAPLVVPYRVNASLCAKVL